MAGTTVLPFGSITTLPGSASAPTSKSTLMKFDRSPIDFFNHRHKLEVREKDGYMEKLSRDGDTVENIATLRYPAGVMVEDEYWKIEEAAQTTRNLMQNKKVPAIFEAGFLMQDETNPMDLGVAIRADVLKRIPEQLITERYQGLEDLTTRMTEALANTNLNESQVQMFLDELFIYEAQSPQLYHTKQHALALKVWLLSLLPACSTDDLAKSQLLALAEMAKANLPTSETYHGLHTQWQRLIKHLNHIIARDTHDEPAAQKRNLRFIKSFDKLLASQKNEFLDEGLFGMLEVKSISGIYDKNGKIPSNKKKYLLDLGIQLYVSEQEGLNINRAGITHVNPDYVHPENGRNYDPDTFLATTYLTQTAREMKERVQTLIQDAQAAAISPNRPETNDDSPTHISKLYKMRPDLLNRLIGAGITDMMDPHIEEKIQAYNVRANALNDSIKEFNKTVDKPERVKKHTLIKKFSAQQQRQINAVQNGEIFVDQEGLKKALAQLKYPLSNMDFESFNGALPILKGMKPFMENPLQVSHHVLFKNGKITHDEYLTDGDMSKDLLRNFAESLLEMMEKHQGSIIVYYESYEKGCLKMLANRYPDLAERIEALSERIVDLLKIIQAHVFHPKFGKSFSIKSTLPALVPDLSYEGLNIKNGTEAIVALEKVLDPKTPKKEKLQLRKDLLAYCRLDTLAMVKIYEVLVDLSEAKNPQTVIPIAA